MREFEPWFERWNLIPDGLQIRTDRGLLVPVCYRGVPAMLKLALDAEEARGGETLAWWDGDGAAKVYEIDGPALLMERLIGKRSLGEMASGEQDDEATRILCAVARNLHAPRANPAPALTDLRTWFATLWRVAPECGGVLAHAAAVAQRLIETEKDRVVLHGDLHHGNVLDSGSRGWLAIDPKSLYGERSFDFVNILRNPDSETSLRPGRFARQVEVIVEAARLDRHRFLEWIVAFTGLSAAWHYDDHEEPAHDLAINALARSLLDRDYGQV